MAGFVEDLLVYQKAREEEKAISAILERPAFRKFPELRQQMDETSARVPRHILEGSGQKTDRHFAHFLFVARGEAQEMRGLLNSAQVRRCISLAELNDHAGQYLEIAKMLTGLAAHLERENRKFRA